MKVSDTLYAAADYIQMHGWKKRSYGWDGGPRCIAGACESVGHPISAFFSEYDPVARALSVVMGDCAIGDFNDWHCNSADDAVAACVIAADIACAEGN